MRGNGVSNVTGCWRGAGRGGGGPAFDADAIGTGAFSGWVRDDAEWLAEQGWKLTKSTAGHVIKAGDPGLQEAIKAGTKYGALFLIFTVVDQLTTLAGLQPGLA